MIKIYSDGTPASTRVFQENGIEIRGITSIVWSIAGPDGIAKATLTFEDVLVDVKGEVG